MSNNTSKKLELKADIIKHLEIAHRMQDKGVDSSFVKVALLERDFYRDMNNQDALYLGRFKEDYKQEIKDLQKL